MLTSHNCSPDPEGFDVLIAAEAVRPSESSLRKRRFRRAMPGLGLPRRMDSPNTCSHMEVVSLT